MNHQAAHNPRAKTTALRRGVLRYGFNGQDRLDEIHVSHYSAEFWEYDGRIGRRWNIDPVVYSWQSGYAVFNNNPTYFRDPLGAE